MSVLSPLVVLSGPSGCGKTTLCRRVRDRLGYHYGVSHTTRPRRPNEVEGVDYYFINQDFFDQMVVQGRFIEWAGVYDFCYGTSYDEVESHRSQGQGVILDLDTQGGLALKKCYPDAQLIFIDVADEDTLKQRLQARGRDDDPTIRKRLALVHQEMSRRSFYDHHVLNADLEEAYHEIARLLLPA